MKDGRFLRSTALGVTIANIFQYLVHIRHNAKHSLIISQLSSWNSPLLLLLPFYIWGNWSLVKLSNLLEDLCKWILYYRNSKIAHQGLWHIKCKTNFNLSHWNELCNMSLHQYQLVCFCLYDYCLSSPKDSKLYEDRNYFSPSISSP